MSIPHPATPKLTPREILALEPGTRLEYFESIQVTSPEIAALIIRTALRDVKPILAIDYYETVKQLVLEADPLQTYLLAARFVKTSNKQGLVLEVHQFFSTVLNRLITSAGYTRAYTWHMSEGIAIGTYKYPIVQRPETAANCPLQQDDCVLFRKDDLTTVPGKRYRMANFIRVELAADWPEPE